MAIRVIEAFGDEAAAYPLPSYTPLAAGIIGGIVACIAGRERTRIDNFVIGGLFAGLASFRDPRANIAQTLLVASIEGLVWGATDRIVPEIKEKILPAEVAPATA